jgi:hypothetical protein
MVLVSWKIIQYSHNTINVFSHMNGGSHHKNLIIGTHHLCEMREYIFLVFLEY